VRVRSSLLIVCAVVALSSVVAIADAGQDKKETPFSPVVVKPLLALHELPQVTGAPYVTITGVVFSRVPIDRVTVEDRNALIRPAQPQDLVKLERVPDGASDAPFRTYFEVPDAGLARFGANDLDIRAVNTREQESDLHRITIIRRVEQEEPAE
jgi:hypothetical protein